jgi:Flp pilus assembly protein TadD
MTSEEEIEIRVELASLHARVGECELALDSLSRAADLAEDPGPLASALGALRAAAACAPAGAAWRGRLAELERRLIERPAQGGEGGPRLATSTLAELLERQGQLSSALRTAEQVLVRDPEDARARAVQHRLRTGDTVRRRAARLERWLVRLERRFAGGLEG